MSRFIEFSEEQKKIANQVDLVDFLRKQGEGLEKSGKEFRWMKNSSVTIKGNRWFQHKYQEGGYPIKFLQKFFGYTYPEAVQCLLNESGVPYEQFKNAEENIKEFHPPERNESQKRIYGYLLKQRCIDSKVLNEFIGNHKTATSGVISFTTTLMAMIVGLTAAKKAYIAYRTAAAAAPDTGRQRQRTGNSRCPGYRTSR